MAYIKSDSPLITWLNGKETIASFKNKSRLSYSKELSGWVALHRKCQAYESLEVEAQSLEEAWDKTDKYIESALPLIHTVRDELPENAQIEHEDRREIIFKLGEPPLPCLPIYIFTTEENGIEKIVYIGKTNSIKSRFMGGHTAGIKLLNPKYNNCQKSLYLCQIMLLSDFNDYLPLEWVRPRDIASKILDEIESKLIFHFQPELNTNKKKKIDTNFEIDLQLVNYVDKGTLFMHDHI